jgi:gamma-glutamyltranspeptidase/glutathione hydrolase
MAEGIEWRIESFEEDGIDVNFSKHFAHAKSGTVFKQPALAASLKRIALHGRDGFYKGKTAELFSQFMAKNGGIINKNDLANYQAVWRKPIVQNWRDQTIITAPPPSSGGIAVVQWLTMYDLVKGKQKFSYNSKDYIHILAEIGKRVFADRAEYLGDPDFVEVPVKPLLASRYLKKRVKDISLSKISPTKEIVPGLEESHDTTHFSIIDKWGNAVSNTTTINYTFGSGIVIDELGFILNDEMDDFSAKKGVANVFGALGGTANEIQPHKRMLSSMTPTIMLKNGEVSLITGAPGGTTIISSVYQSILHAIEFNMNAKQAVNAIRFHHQLWPKDEIEFQEKDKITHETLKYLDDMGYENIDGGYFGDIQLILRSDDKYHAASTEGEYSRSVSMTLEQ